MEVSREERRTDIAQERSPGQLRSYVDRTHVSDMCRWGGCSVAGIQVTVERAGAESPLTPIYSGQGGFLPEGEVSEALGRMGGKQAGECGYGTKNTGLLSQCQLPQMPPYLVPLERWPVRRGL